MDYTNVPEEQILQDRVIALQNIKREKDRIADMDRALFNIRNRRDVAAAPRPHEDKVQVLEAAP